MHFPLDGSIRRRDLLYALARIIISIDSKLRGLRLDAALFVLIQPVSGIRDDTRRRRPDEMFWAVTISDGQADSLVD